MIRANRKPRPDTCCTSADVLTPPERHCEARNRGMTPNAKGFAKPQQFVYRNERKTWGDDPAIRQTLESLMGKAK